MPDNKVKFGLSKCYYAVYTEGTTGGTYATPVALPGAVSLSLDQEGETNAFRADNIDYYVSVSNNGYSGDLELALIPDSFLTSVMGETVDTSSGLQYELADANPKAFALLFQFEGDQKATRHVLYNCKATRPTLNSETTGETIEPVTETITIRAAARDYDHLVKAKCKEGDTSYSTFFSAVVVPTVSTST